MTKDKSVKEFRRCTGSGSGAPHHVVRRAGVVNEVCHTRSDAIAVCAAAQFQRAHAEVKLPRDTVLQLRPPHVQQLCVTRVLPKKRRQFRLAYS